MTRKLRTLRTPCIALLAALFAFGCTKARCAEPSCGRPTDSAQRRMSSGHYRIELAVDSLTPLQAASPKHRIRLSIDTARLENER